MQTTLTADLGVPKTSHASAYPWLRSARWDLGFLTLSVALVAIPYAVYLFYVIFGGGSSHDAGVKGTTAYNARVMVNYLVALLIGGPHMYATFTRTIMDRDFLRKRFAFVASSVFVPIAVVTMILYSYESYVWLLTIFFSMASIHALHQLVWVSEAYNKRSGHRMSLFSRAVDYGVVFSSLYPIAVWKMADRNFNIGPMSLKFNDLLGGQYWLAYVAFAAFFGMLLLFIGKTVLEYRDGRFNLPKTLLISFTVTVMFWTPTMPNMDTAFQGINVWHSFQYLALTWYANRLRERRTGKRIGFLHLWEDLSKRARRVSGSGAGGVQRTRGFMAGVFGTLRKVDRDTGWSTFYMLCLSMLPISGMLILAAGKFWPHVHGDMPGSDEAYTYMGILSILLVHYVHDALLFTDHDAIVAEDLASGIPVKG
jgi:hypothetical protein